MKKEGIELIRSRGCAVPNSAAPGRDVGAAPRGAQEKTLKARLHHIPAD